MCYALYLAVPGSGPPPVVPLDDDDAFCVWPVANGSVSARLGSDLSCWIVGDGRHCSCGRVNTYGMNSGEIVLDERAARYLADAADHAGHVAFTVHWASGLFSEENLGFDATIEMTAKSLRAP